MRKTVYILILLVVAACQTEYSELLKSDDVDAKYAAAKEYYQKARAQDSAAKARINKEKEESDSTDTKGKRSRFKERKARNYYSEALPIFESLLADMRLTGDRRLEEVYYYFAYCWAGTGDYATAAFHFKIFKDTYTRSKRREDAWFMYAYCKYILTYPVQLDQSSTYAAIQELNLFVTQYPKSEHVPDCNDYIDDLRDRLRQKAYNQAMLYYQIANYKAAITSIRNLINDYPSIEDKEKLSFLILECHLKYAEKSVRKKQQERYEETIEEFDKFKKAFPESTYLPQAEYIKKQAENAIEEIKKEEEEAKKEEGSETTEEGTEEETTEKKTDSTAPGWGDDEEEGTEEKKEDNKE